MPPCSHAEEFLKEEVVQAMPYLPPRETACQEGNRQITRERHEGKGKTYAPHEGFQGPDVPCRADAIVALGTSVDARSRPHPPGP